MKRYESSTGTSSKFWEIEQKGRKVVVRWGPIGRKASSKTHTFASAAEATKKHDALVREKTKSGYRAVSTAASLTPRPKQKPTKPKAVPATLKKQLETMRGELDAASSDGIKAVLPAARKLLELAARIPYGSADALREDAELDALMLLQEVGAKQEATKLWLQLIDNWSASTPPTGGIHWFHIAELQRQLGAKIPASMRERVRSAWASGAVSFTYEQTDTPSLPKPPKDPHAAFEQASAEIRQQQFDRARACLDVARKKFREPARILDVLLLHEQGDRDGAHFAARALVNEARRADSYGNWSVVAGLLIYIGIEDGALAKQVLAAWKKRARASGTHADSAIFES